MAVSQSAVAHAMPTVKLTVTTLGGQVAWGPEDMPCATQIAELERAVAESMHAQVEEIRLLLGGLELKSELSLTAAGVPDSAELQAVRVDPWTEPAERALERLISSAAEGGGFDDGEELTVRRQAVREAEAGAWLAGIAAACGCRDAGNFPEGLPGDVKAMLEAIRKHGKSFRQGYFSISPHFLAKNCFSGPGLLCLDSHNSEYGFFVVFVDLTGAVAEIYGAPAGQYKGAVWRFSCGEDCWGDLLRFYSVDLSSVHTVDKWERVVSLSREAEQLGQAFPYPLSPSLEAFFSKWGTERACPALVGPDQVFEGTDAATFRIPEVVAFKQLMERRFKDKEREAELAKQHCLLPQIFSFLDAEGNGHLSCSDLRPLGEVGGWLTSDSTADEFYDVLAALCKDKGFETSSGISESAFVGCFMHMPFSPDTDQYYPVEDGMTTHTALKDYLKTLRAGPHCKGHYLGPLKRDELTKRALVQELFQLLDKDSNGFISGSELQPFVELYHGSHPGGWDPPPPTPWNSAAFTEEASAEQWSRQFGDLCEQRGLPAEMGLSESSFKTYLEEMNIYHTELAWGAEMLRLGPPPCGHHMSWVDFSVTNGLIRPGAPRRDSDAVSFEDVSGAAEWQDYALGPFKAAYEWALQGSPRKLAFSFEGVEYSLTAIPERHPLLDEWNLVERAPKQYKWVLEPR